MIVLSIYQFVTLFKDRDEDDPQSKDKTIVFAHFGLPVLILFLFLVSTLFTFINLFNL